MTRLLKAKPILHALAWILIYLMAVNLGDALAGGADQMPFVTGGLLVLLSLGLWLYIHKTRLAEHLGLSAIKSDSAQKALYWLPLLLIALAQLVLGFDDNLTSQKVLAICIMMLGVGFVEEVLFRGFLYKAIESKSNTRRAVLISGITFGLGHVLNLLRGAALQDQIGQIALAIAVGIMLALLVAVTGNLMPGILFHIAFNIIGSLTVQDSPLTLAVLAAMVIISVCYAWYLYRRLGKG